MFLGDLPSVHRHLNCHVALDVLSLDVESGKDASNKVLHKKTQGGEQVHKGAETGFSPIKRHTFASVPPERVRLVRFCEV